MVINLIIKVYLMIENEQSVVFGAFQQLFKQFNIQFNSIGQLIHGSILPQFLSNVQGFNLDNIINEDIKVYGSAFNNLNLIVSKITHFQHNVLKNYTYTINIDIYETYYQQNKSNLQKLLIEVLRVAIQGPNSEIFVRKVMQLEEYYQNVFIQLIKTFIKPNSALTSPKQTNKIDQIISDKIQWLQSQNQYLQNQLKIILEENKDLQSSLKKYQHQIYQLKSQNHNLRSYIAQLEDKISNLDHHDFKSQQSRNQALDTLRQQNQNIIEFYKGQQDSLIEAYDARIQQLNQIIELKNQDILSLKQNLSASLEQVGLLTTKSLQCQRQKFKLKQTLKIFEQLSKQLQQRLKNTNLKVNIKQTQVQQLKRIVKLRQGQKYMEGNKALIKQIINLNQKQYALTDQIYKDINFYIDQVDRLKQIIQTQIQQLNQTSKYIQKNKQIQEENKKLRKLLHQYENYRGQQNQLILGCLYQLRMNFRKSNVQSNKQGLKQKHLSQKKNDC